MKKVELVLFTLIAFSFTAFSADKLSITNASVDTNMEFFLDINLENNSAISAMQFDVDLDITKFKLISGSELNTLRVDGHDFSVSKISDSKLRVIIFSSANKNLIAGTGKLFSIKLESKTDPGNYIINLSEIIASSSSGETVTLESQSGNITINAPKIVINTTNLNFDKVPLQQTKILTFNIYNQGNKDLIINGLKNSITPFEVVTEFPITISMGSSKTFEVKFTSTTKGNFTSHLKFNSNDPDLIRKEHSISLNAISFAVNELKIGSFSGYSNKPIEIIVSVNNMEKFIGFQFDLNLPYGFEYISNSEKYLGRDDGHQIGIAQNSQKITFIGYSNTNKSFTGNDGNLFSFEIQGNISYGYYGLNMSNVILTDSASQNIISQHYNGSVQIYSPRMGLSTTNINFGNVDLTDSVTGYIELRNYGNDTLKVTSANFESNEVNWDIEVPFILLNWESKSGNFKFKPSQKGTHSSKVLINHNDPDKVSKINFSANVFSPNYFYVKSKKARVGEIISMPFHLKNNDEVTGFQLDIEEPDKLTFDLSNLSLSSRKTDHIITYSKISNKNYRIICYSPSSSLFSGDNGEIFYIPISIGSDISPGIINFNLSSVIISDINTKNIVSPNFSNGSLTIENNQLPVSLDDNYSSQEGSNLSINLQNGVLSNDTDGNDDNLKAILVSSATGAVSLNDDGSFTYSPPFSNYTGTDSFTYKANDGIDDGNTATVNISVIKINAPVAANDFYSINEENILNINLFNGILSNDTDEEDDELTASLVSNVSNGNLSLNTNGSFIYTPNINFFGIDNFTYKANDGTSDSNIGIVTITVNNTNDIPESSNISVTTNEDITKSIVLLGNDIDGDSLIYKIISQPTNGSIVINGPILMYTPKKNYNGIDSITYVANDGIINSDTSTISITIIPINDSPTSSNMSTITDEDKSIDITLIGSDVETTNIIYSLVTSPANGAIILTDNIIKYSPNLNYNGLDSLTYKVNDGSVNGDTSKVLITIRAINDAPTSYPRVSTTEEETTVDISLSGSDIDGDSLNFKIIDYPLYGTVIISSSIAKYSPNINYNGIDSLTYVANDGIINSDTSKILITITEKNDAPLFLKNTYTYNVSEADTINTILFQILAEDEENDSLSYSITTSNLPFSVDSNGIIKLDSILDYETKASYSFNLRVTDQLLNDNTTININVLDEKPTIKISPSNINFGIVETGNLYTKNISILNEGKDTLYISKIESNLSSSVTSTIIEGDFIISGSGKSYQIKYNPNDINNEEGFFSILNNSNSNNVKIYIKSEVLAENFIYSNAINPFPSEKDTLKFILNNPNAVIGFQLDINITSDIIFDLDNVYLSDRKEDHSISTSLIEDNKIRIISYSLSSSPFSGNEGILFYLPIEIPDTLKPKIYTLTSSKTVISSVSATNIAKNLNTLGTIKVGNFNPNGVNDLYFTNEDVNLGIDSIFGLLNNDNDLENNFLSVELLTSPSNGTLNLKSNGSFNYSPNENYFGTDKFIYKVKDAFGTSDSTSVIITINPVNDSPIGFQDTYSTNEDINLINNISVLENDSDIENDTLKAILLTTTLFGNLNFNIEGIFEYTPNLNFYGVDNFTYKLSDGFIETDTINVTINVKSINDIPKTLGELYITNEDTPISTGLDNSILKNDFDIENSTLIPEIVKNVSFGTLSLSPDGSFVYTSNDNYNGSDNFTYKVTDGDDYSNISEVTIIINPVNDAPIAQPDFYITQENVSIVTFSNVGIIANDIDIENQALTITLIDSVSYGSLNLEYDGSFSYVPNTNYFGNDTFTYTISDGYLTSDTAIVTITINEINYPPVSSDIIKTTNEDVSVEISLLASDPNNGDILSYIISNNPSNGILSSLNDNILTYIPSENFYGVDSFTYIVKDFAGLSSNSSTVTITIDSIYDPPFVILEVDKTSIDENGGEAIISAVTTGVDAGGAEVIVTLSTSGTASNSDYSLSLNNIIIPKSSTSSNITISALSDTEDESDENIIIKIDSVENAFEDGNQEINIIIIDNYQPLGVENIHFIEKIYPNPASNILNIELKENINIKEIHFIDFKGKILSDHKNLKRENKVSIDVSKLNGGIYILEIVSSSGTIKTKIIIEK